MPLAEVAPAALRAGMVLVRDVVLQGPDQVLSCTVHYVHAGQVPQEREEVEGQGLPQW